MNDQPRSVIGQTLQGSKLRSLRPDRTEPEGIGIYHALSSQVQNMFCLLAFPSIQDSDSIKSYAVVPYNKSWVLMTRNVSQGGLTNL